MGRLESFASALDRALEEDGVVRVTVGFKSGGVDLTPGLLKPTGAPLDVAIEGRGFFVVETLGGPLYTRNGRFHRNALGALVTADGAGVAGRSGPVFLPPGDVTISRDGRILVNSQEVDRLTIVRFNAPERLERRGATMFASDEAPVPVDRPAIQAGFLEMSNVTMISQLVELITTLRSFESNQRAAQLQDDSLREAIALAAE